MENVTNKQYLHKNSGVTRKKNFLNNYLKKHVIDLNNLKILKKI